MGTPVPPERTTMRYKIHCHVLFTHFLISFFMASLGFMVLHLITWVSCFELAAYLSLVAGLVALLPTVVSGWLVWKGR